MARPKKRPLTTQERQQRRAAQRERLEHATEELLSSDGWVRWLRARAVLHTYSLLISGGGVRSSVASECSR